MDGGRCWVRTSDLLRVKHNPQSAVPPRGKKRAKRVQLSSGKLSSLCLYFACRVIGEPGLVQSLHSLHQLLPARPPPGQRRREVRGVDGVVRGGRCLLPLPTPAPPSRHTWRAAGLAKTVATAATDSRNLHETCMHLDNYACCPLARSFVFGSTDCCEKGMSRLGFLVQQCGDQEEGPCHEAAGYRGHSPDRCW